MDARNFFNTAGTQPQSALKRNQFGGDVGGPIRHGHTYFFASYEGLRHRQGLNTASNVLSDAQRTAIQAGTNTIAQALLPLIPVANSAPGATPTFFGSASANVNIDQGTIDISHNFSDNDRLHGYYVNQKDFRQEPTQGANIPGFGDTREGHRQVVTLNETHVFSSSLVNEARIGANRLHILFNPNNATDPASLGLAGVLGPNQTFMPTIRIQDLGLVFGDERNFPQGRGDTTYVLADSLNYIRGSHSLKFGVEFRDFRNNNFNGDPGQLFFNTTSNFINGTVDTSARTLNNVANRIDENALEFFAQDSYKIRPSLTLELGLRYAWNKSPNEAKDRFVNFDLTSAELVPVSDAYNQNNKNFQPRVGFAWDPFRSGKTVLRGAYGYQVDQPITGIVTGLSSNPPFAVPISVNTATPINSLGAQYDPANAANLAPLVVNPDFRNANVQSWNLNLQQRVAPTLGVMVGYFGNKGTHLEIDRNINQFATLGTASSRPFTAIASGSQFFPGTSLSTSLTFRDSSANSNYNALWVTANKTTSRGVQFNASYTWSHSIDEVSRNNQLIFVQDSTNIESSRGSSDFDVRHRFVANAIYDFPFKGNRLVSGWRLATIFSAQTGNPFTVVLARATTTGTANVVRPDLVAPVTISGDPSQWITNAATAFSLPAVGSFGNLGRNTIYGPGFTNVDLSLVKNTKITERVNLQFRTDVFDLFNHPNFGQPGPVAGNGATVITLTPLPGGGFSVPASFSNILTTRFPTSDSGSSRQLQLALKLQF